MGEIKVTHSGVGIEFSFPLGRYHATSPGTTANEAKVEWPPSPWRILRAMVSVWKRRQPSLADAQVVPLLDQLAGPCLFQLPTGARGHTRHYLVGDETTFLTVDAFASVAKGAGLIAWWPEAELTNEQRGIVGQLCAELTYLGRAESLCDARLLDHHEHTDIRPNSTPGNQSASDQSIRLLTPERPLSLSDLCIEWSQLRGNAKTRSVTPPRAHYIDYTTPAADVSRTRSPSPRPTAPVNAVRFALISSNPDRRDPRPRLSDTLTYTTALRAAAQSAFGSLNEKSASPALSGRNGDQLNQGHDHAHYLAVSDHQDRIEARKITSLVIWAPGGFTKAELTALGSVHHLHGFDHVPGFSSTSLLVTGFGDVTDVAPELCNESRTFVSETASVPGRHPKGQRTWEEQLHLELTNALNDRGLPTASIDIGRRVRPFRTTRPSQGRNTARRGHPQPFEVTLTFDVAQAGPITLGALSHFGLGLFRPV